jgi:hypothetical protein
VLAYERTAGADRCLVLVNFTGEPVAVPASGRVVVASDTVTVGQAFDGTLGPDAAVILAD